MSKKVYSTFQTLLLNGTPGSLTISAGSPWCLTMLSMNRVAISSAEGMSLTTTKCAIFVRRSTTTMMVLQPLDQGSSTTKSMEMGFQGRSGAASGWRRPIGRLWLFLILAHTEQEATYWAHVCVHRATRRNGTTIGESSGCLDDPLEDLSPERRWYID